MCAALEPAEEICDFQDNDCDGVVDENFKNELGKYAVLNHCGGCGKDCEGLFPNATAYCDDSGPVPFCAVADCAPGFYKEGDFQCLPYENNACQPCAADFQCSGGNAWKWGEAPSALRCVTMPSVSMGSFVLQEKRLTGPQGPGLLTENGRL